MLSHICNPSGGGQGEETSGLSPPGQPVKPTDELRIQWEAQYPKT